MPVLMLTGGSPPTARTYSFAQTSHTNTEGQADIPIQVVASVPWPQTDKIPFTLLSPHIPVAQRAVRGEDYDLVDANGDPLPGDYFEMAPNTTTAAVYLRALEDGVVDGTKVRNMQIVASNAHATMQHGVVGSPAECVFNIVDATQLILGWESNGSQVTEPDGANTVTVAVRATLSALSPTEQRAQVTATSPTAVLGTDYSLPLTELVLPPNTRHMDFQVQVHGNDTPNPNHEITLLIQTPTGGATLNPAAVEHVLEILDNDVAAPVIGFADAHNGVVTLREGDPTIGLRVEVRNGAPLTENVTIPWGIFEVGGSGINLGEEILAGSANPLIMAQAVGASTLALRAPQLSGTNPPRQFEVRLLSATGSGASLDTEHDTLDGTLVDTSTALPVLHWELDAMSVLEGSTAQAFLVTDIPAPNPINLQITRIGSAGPPDLSYPGDGTGGVLTFPQGETRFPVPMSAIADGVNDPGEMATFIIGEGAGFTMGTNSQLIVTVLEVSTGSTTLEFTPMPAGMPTLIDCVTGMDPTPITSPPPMAIAGVRADVFPVDVGRRDGKARAWQFIAHADAPSGQAELVPATGSEPWGEGYRTDDLSNLTFQFQTHSHNRPGGQMATHTVKLSEGLLVEVPREGHYEKDEVWLLRPRLASEAGTKHEHCCQIKLWITRRPHSIGITGMLTNEGFDPANPNAPGFWGSKEERHELDSKVHFDELKALPPASTLLRQQTPSRCAGAGGTLIKPSASGKPHRITPGRSFAFEFDLFQLSDAGAHRDAVASKSGWAIAESGGLAFDKKGWYGLMARPIPRYGTGYVAGGFEGREASRFIGRQYLNLGKAIIAGSLADDTWRRNVDLGIGNRNDPPNYQPFPGEEDSWYEPAIMEDTYRSGGEQIDMHEGFDHTVELMRGMMLRAYRLVQANPIGITNIRTGHQLSAQDLADINITQPLPPHNSTAPGKLPFVQGIGQATFGTLVFPYFAPISSFAKYFSGDPPPVAYDLCLRPTDRDWSQAPPGGICESLMEESIGPPTLDPSDHTLGYGTANDHHGQWDFDHYCRVNTLYQGLAWSRNSSWAKDMLRRDAAHIERGHPKMEIGDILWVPGVQTEYNGLSGGLDYVRRSADTVWPNGTNSHEWGAFKVVLDGNWENHKGDIYRRRGAGHAIRAQAAGGVMTPPSHPHYAEQAAWWDKWLETAVLIATPAGVGDREAFIWRGGGNPMGAPNDLSFPWKDASHPNNAWHNPLSNRASCCQAWMQVFLGFGMFGGFLVYDNVQNLSRVEKWAVKMPLGFTRVSPNGNRTPGRPRGNFYAISSNGQNGGADPPSEIPIEHPLVPVQGQNHLDGMAQDTSLPIFGVGVQAMHSVGMVSERDELLRYVKLHLGLDENASLQALANELNVRARLRTNQNFFSGRHYGALAFDLHGTVQQLLNEQSVRPAAPEIIGHTVGAGTVTLEVQ